MAARSLTRPVSLLQAAEGLVLGSPAPALLGRHELLPLPALPGGDGSGADPGGTALCTGASPTWLPWSSRGALPGGLGLAWGWCAPLHLPGWGVRGPLLSYFPCLSLQILLSECVAPHMEDVGTVSASAPAPAAYLCKMFR